MIYAAFPLCKCARCQEPVPGVTIVTQAEALALNRAYVERRCRYREEEAPIVVVAGEHGTRSLL